MIAVRDRGRVDHDVGVDGVERLDDLGVGQQPLDHLGERIRVGDEQARRHAVREIERIGDIDKDLVADGLGAGGDEAVERALAVEGADDPFAMGGGFGEDRQRDAVVGLEPVLESSIWLSAGARASEASGSRVPSATSCPSFGEFGGDGAADHAGSENGEFHRSFLCSAGRLRFRRARSIDLIWAFG